jgi:hypothetical protein
MASSTPRTTEQFRAPDLTVGDFHVNELAADKAGALSPFGPEVEFPLPLDQIRYTHPSPADRPHLADGR